MFATTDRGLARSILPTIVAIAAGALVAGCGDDEKKAAAAKPTAFPITATSEGKTKKAIEFPSTVKAGLVTMTFKNADTIPRSAGIVRLLGDHTVSEFRKAIAKQGTPIPDWIQDGGGVSTVKPGETASVTQVLTPGRYAIADDETLEADGEGKDLADLGAKGEFTVTGEAGDATLPTEPATLTAKEYGFEFKGLKAGRNNVRFENTGKELHHAVMFPISKGKTFADAKASFTSDKEPTGPPPVDFANGLSTQVIDGGIAQNLELDLKAGSYAVVCFIQDRKGGAPHVAKGMINELVVK
jgi:uncharacterized protein (DUF2141 family)